MFFPCAGMISVRSAASKIGSQEWRKEWPARAISSLFCCGKNTAHMVFINCAVLLRMHLQYTCTGRMRGLSAHLFKRACAHFLCRAGLPRILCVFKYVSVCQCSRIAAVGCARKTTSVTCVAVSSWRDHAAVIRGPVRIQACPNTGLPQYRACSSLILRRTSHSRYNCLLSLELSDRKLTGVPAYSGRHPPTPDSSHTRSISHSSFNFVRFSGLFWLVQ